jgi:hypothetical protein
MAQLWTLKVNTLLKTVVSKNLGNFHVRHKMLHKFLRHCTVWSLWRHANMEPVPYTNLLFCITTEQRNDVSAGHFYIYFLGNFYAQVLNKLMT